MSKVKFLWIVFCLLLPAFTAAAAPAEMSVQVRPGELRATPSFLGAIVGRVSYGDRVGVLESQGPWFKVYSSTIGKTGWIHSSALTTERIELKAGAAVEQSASSDELALAGKGFNEQVEESFKAKNPKLDFIWVNKMEKFTVTDEQIRRFLQQGDLVLKAGVR